MKTAGSRNRLMKKLELMSGDLAEKENKL